MWLQGHALLEILVLGDGSAKMNKMNGDRVSYQHTNHKDVSFLSVGYSSSGN